MAKMSKRMLKALKGSIKKWDKIVKGTGTDGGTKNCSLCTLYNRIDNCGICIVKKKTGMDGCQDTPYAGWDFHHDNKHRAVGSYYAEFPYKTECPVCKKLAKAELKFLKSLLPKGE